MRDKRFDKNYFKRYVSNKVKLMDLDMKAIVDGSVPKSKAKWVQYRNLIDNFELIVAKYSQGDHIYFLKDDINLILDKMKMGWHSSCTILEESFGRKHFQNNQYMFEPYGYLLRILSIAYLLKLSEDRINVLAKLINKDKVFDLLLDFMINSRLQLYRNDCNEIYDKRKSIILRIYNKLRKAIQQKQKSDSEKFIKEYLEKDFYNKHTGFYDFHKSRFNLYYGYWSFEAAAITCIMDLDDSSYRDNQYYPKDFVAYFKQDK